MHPTYRCQISPSATEILSPKLHPALNTAGNLSIRIEIPSPTSTREVTLCTCEQCSQASSAMQFTQHDQPKTTTQMMLFPKNCSYPLLYLSTDQTHGRNNNCTPLYSFWFLAYPNQPKRIFSPPPFLLSLSL